jgi:hypothetical protein
MAITPNMLLDLPVVEQTKGPTFASKEVAAFNKIESHNHTTRRGVLVPTAALVIDANLPFNGNTLLAVNAAYLQSSAGTLTTAADYNSTYATAGDWHYTDGNGAAIQLTDSGALNVTAIGTIGGDYTSSTASVFYNQTASKFFFTQATNTAAKMDFGTVRLRSNGVGPNAITLQSPTALAASYAWTLPGSLSGTKMLTVSSAGQIGTYDVDNSTIEVVSNSIQVKNSGISTGKIIDGSVTLLKRAPLQIVESGSSGAFSHTTVLNAFIQLTAFNITFNASNRPIIFALNPDGSGNPSSLAANTNNQKLNSIQIEIRRDGVPIIQVGIVLVADATGVGVLAKPSPLKCMDISPGTGNKEYTFWVRCRSGQPDPQNQFFINYYKMVAYEEF